MNAHLSGGVKRKLGRNSACKGSNAHILDYERVGVGFCGNYNRLPKLFKFLVKNYRIYRNIQLYAVNMAINRRFFQLFLIKIFCRSTGRKQLFTDIHCVCAAPYGGNNAVKAACGRKYLNFFPCHFYS